MSQVIIKRIPQEHVIQAPEESIPISCDCVDPVFGTPIPDCKMCNGKGKIQGYLPAESIITTTTTKKPWISKATIIRETSTVVFDDEEEEGIISDVNAFFDKDEDIQVGDIVIDSATRDVFIVVRVRDVRNLDNVIMKECALEIYKPPVT